MKEFQKEIQSYFKKKGIKVYFGDDEPSRNQKIYIKFDTLEDNDLENLKNYFSLFKSEFDKYDQNFIEKTKLEQVNFVKNLLVDNTGTNRFVPISTVPDPDSSSLIFDIFHEPKNDTYDRQCIHHEFFHLIEFNVNGKFVFDDPEWHLFNPNNFKYGNGGAVTYFDPNFKNVEHPISGFVTTYATLSIDEDRAETFMYMMTDHLKDKLSEFIKTDDILRSKVVYLQELLSRNRINSSKYI